MIARTTSFKKLRHSRESGQAMLFLLLALGLFLLGGIALAVDMADLWMHRQASQNAADAACTAAAMDMVNFANGGTNTSGFTPGTAFNCNNSTAAPCKYAGFNGYSSATGLIANTPSNQVDISFPGSVPGVQTCSSTNPPPSVCTETGFPTTAFVRATVTDRTRTFLVGLLSGGTTMDVGAAASCGAILSSAPIPILVLNPTLPNTFNLGGTGTVPKITIYGGPQRSIQVNSSNSGAVTANGNPIVNLSQGGPNLNGSDMGVTGGPNSPPFVYQGSPPGQYLDPVSPISDPFALLPVPPKPAAAPAVTTVVAGSGGCPGTSGSCYVYSPGYYSSGICVGKGGCTNKTFTTALFIPGRYYLDGDFSADSLSCLRPSNQVGDGSQGTFFYFNTGTLNVNSNSGGGCPGSISTTASNGTGQLQFGVKCTTSSQIPANLPVTITGNLLMAPCTGPYGDPLLALDPIGEQHGILFFGNRSAAAVSPSFGGGGVAAALGSLYFHYCNSANGAGLGSSCPSTAYTDQLTLQGGSGSTSYIVGNIVTDQLGLGGTPQIVMDLNPNALYYVLKASLLQ
jgi:hypothetical protein